MSERTYECRCGYVEDRDLKSAICIHVEGLNRLRSVGSEPVEQEASVSNLFDVSHIVLKQEAQSFNFG